MKHAVTSRIKVTKTGKLIRRIMGQSHFLAKKSNRQLIRKNKSVLLSKPDRKVLVKKYGILS